LPNRDIIYLNHILDSITDIEDFVIGYNEITFIGDKKTFNASIKMFEVIGEATKKISTELKLRFSFIEWKKIAGLRDILIYNYEGVDLSAIWQIIRINLPILKIQI